MQDEQAAVLGNKKERERGRERDDERVRWVKEGGESSINSIVIVVIASGSGSSNSNSSGAYKKADPLTCVT